MNPKQFFSELKRRKVYKVALGYAVGGWALAQGIAQVFPIFDVPIWIVRLIVLLIILGFPLALALSWFFDLTRYGIVRTPDLDKIDMEGARTSDHSIAVLPFVDLSPGKDHDYLSDGIAEEILTALSKIDNLRVAARRSAFWFKDRQADLREISSKLNVAHVLEGSVRREENRVRVTAELIDARGGFTIWSDTFEREMQSIFALQDEITRAIVETLKLKLAIAPQAPQSRSLAAYDSYLQGSFYSDKSTEEALRKSIEHFQRALEVDPRFSRAWTGIAKAWLWLADGYVAPLEAYPKVQEAALNALKLDKDDAEAHVYLGETKRILDWNMDGAAREFCRALALDPKSTPSNYFSAAFFAVRGEREEALKYLKRTATIDPASLWVNNAACELFRYFGLYEEATVAGERSLQLDPAFIFGEPLLAALYREMGRFDEAIALYKRAESVNPRPAFGLAITYAMMQRPDEARSVLARAISARGSYTPGDAVAHVLIALGEHEEAIRELERACDERSSSVHFIGIAPEFKPLRTDKRFVSMVKRLGLEPEKVFAATP
ncbi:MAG: hypothetical protein DME57_01680 [Verrucomicrobia bacterium]|nr:MAG: hypothetical protein DME57_01680 [Verrucomicrobiota bacterium]